MSAEMVLIRGLFRGKYHWGCFPEKLQESFPGNTVISVDIPGSGDLCFEHSPCSIEEMVESIRSQLKIKSNLNLISISMGGMIALKWAELYPDEISSVVCINTSAKGFSPFYQRLLPKNYLKILRALFSSPHRKEPIIYSLVSNHDMDKSVVDYWVSIDRLHPLKRTNFFRQLFAALNFKVKRPETKLLFISSAADRLVSYEATQSIAKKWGSPLIENRGDGHDIALDNPDWLCKQLVRWFELNQ